MADLPIANAILDGEITSAEVSGATSFEALQRALSDNAQDRLHYYLFDALYLDGVDLRRQTLLERKEALRAVISGKHPHLHFSDASTNRSSSSGASPISQSIPNGLPLC
jgi:ATP-dependent DNA ligase